LGGQWLSISVLDINTHLRIFVFIKIQ